MATTADRNASATGFGNHGKRIVRTPNVTVTEHWNIKRLDQFADSAPVGMPTVIFGGSTRVQGNSLATFLLRDMPGFKERLMLVVDADTNLRRDGHIGRIADLDYALDDLAEQIHLPWQRRTAAASGHFGHGTSEIQVDMVSHVFIDDDFRSLFHDCWIHAIQLQRADILAGSEMT